MKGTTSFPTLLESFFTKRLMAQRRASPHTIGSYRDTFRLLLQFAEKRLAKAPSRLTLEDLQGTVSGSVPGLPGKYSCERGAESQFAPDCDSVFFSLRCAGSTPARWADPTCAFDSQQTAPSSACGIPHTT